MLVSGFRYDPNPQDKQVPGAELAHSLQLDRQGTQLPSELNEKPERQTLHVLPVVQVKQFEGHPGWQILVVVFRLYPLGHEVQVFRLLLSQVKQFLEALQVVHSPEVDDKNALL